MKKLRNILVPLLFLTFIIVLVIVGFNKGTRDYFKSWRSVDFSAKNSEKGTRPVALFPFRFFEHPYSGGYVADGKLWFVTSDNQFQAELPEEAEVFNFIYSAKDSCLFYTVMKDDSLVLKRADFKINTVRTSELVSLGRPVHDFLDTLSDRRAEINLAGDTLLIECDYSPDQKSFLRALKCVPQTGYRLLSADDLINRMSIDLIELQQNNEEKFMQNMMMVKLKGFSDLNLIINQETVPVEYYRVVER